MNIYSSRIASLLRDRLWGRMQSRRVLIIEDDVLIAAMEEEILGEYGYQVAAIAATMEQARAALAWEDHDAVLLDLVLREQRADEIADALIGRGVPFAFVTGLDHAPEPRHAHVPFIQKPFSTETLVRQVEQLFDMHRPAGTVAPMRRKSRRPIT